MHISINSSGNIEVDNNYRIDNIERLQAKTIELSERVKQLTRSEHLENLQNAKEYHTNITLLNDILTNFETILERVEL